MGYLVGRDGPGDACVLAENVIDGKSRGKGVVQEISVQSGVPQHHRVMVAEDAGLLPPGVITLGIDFPIFPREEADLDGVILGPVGGFLGGIDGGGCGGIGEIGDDTEVVDVGDVFGQGKAGYDGVVVVFAKEVVDVVDSVSVSEFID